MKTSASKRKLLVITSVCLALVVACLVWLFAGRSRSLEEQKFLGTWTLEGRENQRCFGKRYMTEFYGPSNDVEQWQWSISEPGRIRLHKEVLGRTIEEVCAYRIEENAIIFMFGNGREQTMTRCETVPKLQAKAD